MWLNQSFLLIEELAVPGDLNVTLTSLRTGRPLQLQMRQSGQVTVRTDDMELAGDIIQTLAAFLKVEDLQVRTREASMIRSWHTVKVLPVFFNHDVQAGPLNCANVIIVHYSNTSSKFDGHGFSSESMPVV